MAAIQPFDIWTDGYNITVSEIIVKSSYDDLSSTATFYFQLKEEDTVDGDNVTQGKIARSGNISMYGEEYDNWDDSNAAAYVWVADKLNVILV